MELLLGKTPWEETSNITKIVLGAKNGKPIGVANELLYSGLDFTPKEEQYYPDENIVYVNVVDYPWKRFTMCEVREALIKARNIMLQEDIDTAAFCLPKAVENGVSPQSFSIVLHEVFKDCPFILYKQSVRGLSKTLSPSNPTLNYT